ncbi:MAG: phosphatase PAP2 family protein [Myxococcales bacterium]|nr:phosphatase PAP2 family protein [Myxococcales bacterium]
MTPPRRLLITFLSLSLVLCAANNAHAKRAAPRYKVDAVTDSAVTASAALIALFSQLAISSGELTAQTPGPTENLSFIDRWVAERDDFEEGSRLSSNILLGVAAGFVAVDSVISGWLGGVRAGLTDALFYTQSILINIALVNIVKLTVRRPRPEAYWQVRNSGTAGNEKTDLALSFYSGHAAFTAGVTATASYLAFRRYGVGWRSFLTLGVGIALTAAVSIERVRSLAHFPSDVITGAIVGAAVGLLVPHFHFQGYEVQPTAAPVSGGGAVVGFAGKL